VVAQPSNDQVSNLLGLWESEAETGEELGDESGHEQVHHRNQVNQLEWIE